MRAVCAKVCGTGDNGNVIEGTELALGAVAGAAAPLSRMSAAKDTHARVFALLRQAAPHGHVLDLPAGSGAFTRRLLDADYRATAGDLDAHPALPQEATFAPCNMDEPLPFADAGFDAVCSIEGIEHIRRPFDFIRECRRVLAPGAPLLLSTPNISSLRSRFRHLLTGFHNKGKHPLDETQPAPRHHINLLSFPALRYMLHTQGFEIETVATNQVKAAAWCYAPLVPLAWWASRSAFRRGIKNPDHARVTHAVLRQMCSRAVLFGETLIVVARAR